MTSLELLKRNLPNPPDYMNMLVFVILSVLSLTAGHKMAQGFRFAGCWTPTSCDVTNHVCRPYLLKIGFVLRSEESDTSSNQCKNNFWCQTLRYHRSAQQQERKKILTREADNILQDYTGYRRERGERLT